MDSVKLKAQSPPSVKLIAGGTLVIEGEIPINENGTYNVTQFATAKVTVKTYEQEYQQAQTEIAQDNGYFSDISDAIVAKDGGSAPEKEDMATRIEALPTNQPLFSDNGAMYFTEMKIPNTVTSIKNYAYQNCSGINKLEIAGNVKTIGNYAFESGYLTSITSLKLKNGIKTVGVYAFRYHKCTELKLPSSITLISNGAFSGTASNQIIDLSEFTDPSNLPTLSNSNAFNNALVLRYEVANQLMLDAFTAATNWSTYSGKYVIKG